MTLEQIVSTIIPGSWGYLIIFLTTFFGSTPLGMWFPSGTILMIAGFAANKNLLYFPFIVGIAFISALTGDVISYHLGKKYGHKFLKKYGKYFFFKEEYYTKTEKF